MKLDRGLRTGRTRWSTLWIISLLLTVLPYEDVQHRKNLAVVGDECLADEAFTVRSLVARYQRLQYLENLHDHPLLPRVECRCEFGERSITAERSSPRFFR